MWRTEDLGGMELLSATLTEFAFRPHAHEEFFIALTEDGRATPTFRGDSHVIGPGDVIVLNPEEAHAGGPPAGDSWTYRAFYPGPDLMRELPIDRTPEFNGDIIRDPELAARLRRFHRLSEHPATSTLERESRLTEALVLLVSRHATPPQVPTSPGRERKAVRLSRDYLDTHATDNVSLEDLARLAGLSPFHLCRVFSDSVGMAPHTYQTHVRVRRAKALLRTGLPIAQVALEAGFYDQPHFTRHFKRMVGLTPARYAAT